MFDPRDGLLPYRGAMVTLSVELRVTTEVYPPAESPKLRRSSTFRFPGCPAKTADNSELDAFYEDLEEIIRKQNSFYKLVVDDFNAKIEMPEEGEHRIGGFGTGLRNENDNRLVGLSTAARQL
ncbi:unnamed protein product [Strongylus vulgaris]|uniref:Uncharacterized protein n=1 Tax=Strongylus vulgaris TaxID=40348 RepID=A0A3P7IG48_STRVU|nr:unnamed protein product [Strongylus vulgaris]